jgi:RES domain-containing protein
MTLYRFVNKNYGVDISGEGARLKGGRWNSKGFPVVYTSTTISLSLLELLVHSTSYEEVQCNWLMRIDMPDIFTASLTDLSLKPNWMDDPDYSRFIGNTFLKSKKSMLIQVPSAIIPEENNVLINPLHPDLKKVKIIKASPFQFDIRLFK